MMKQTLIASAVACAFLAAAAPAMADDAPAAAPAAAPAPQPVASAKDTQIQSILSMLSGTGSKVDIQA